MVLLSSSSHQKEKDDDDDIDVVVDALPSSLLDLSWVQVSRITKLFGTQGTFVALSIKRGRGAC